MNQHGLVFQALPVEEALTLAVTQGRLAGTAFGQAVTLAVRCDVFEHAIYRLIDKPRAVSDDC